ncbi:MAG: CDP-glycerol glycerophosphotransferase family protein [Candidatus Omnitrophica bacterium]|nr:CDP-glycerol glycerophosphotransferase family protein [Candidatus Omnitrophota bacterium]MCB9720109.1 CDP-glycerol glycerophosphotransferase family protein [Candidatus Omnitrophota bacterium]
MKPVAGTWLREGEPTVNSTLKRSLRRIERALLAGKRTQDVLIPLRNELMYANMKPILERLRGDRRLRLWICLTARERFLPANLRRIRRELGGARMISYRIAEYVKWDLILTAEQTLYFRRDCPMIYTGHSLKSGKLNPAGDSMKYGAPSRHEDGTIKYARIFCANEHEFRTVKDHFPDHAPRVRVVGNLLVDQMLTAGDQRDAILRRLGLDPRRRTLMVTSTWRGDSLAQSQGRELMDKLDDLLKRYNIIVSFHQNNFVREYSPDLDWRAEFAARDCPGLHILRQNETSLACLPAADVLLTDHTSTSLYYLFLNRPVVYYVHPNVRYDKGALILELQKIARTVDSLANLEADIAAAETGFDPDAYARLAAKACSYAGHGWQRMEREIYDTLGLRPFSRLSQQQEDKVRV